MAPTKTATIVYQNRGEDFVHHLDGSGKLVHRIDGTGAVHTPMVEFSDGSQQTSAGVALPPVIDAGTF